MSIANCSSKTQENCDYLTHVLHIGTQVWILLNRGNSFVSMKGSGVCNHTNGLPISYFFLQTIICAPILLLWVLRLFDKQFAWGKYHLNTLVSLEGVLEYNPRYSLLKWQGFQGIWDKNCDCFKILYIHYKPLSGHRYLRSFEILRASIDHQHLARTLLFVVKTTI